MRRPGAAAQRGVGLIEVLVAVLILSIGLLGIALAQTRALANSNSAMARSMAIVASYSILEAMRADRASALTGNYSTVVAADSCPNPGLLSDTQLGSWCEQLGDALGAVASTSAEIDCDAIGSCTILIQFDDSRIGAAGSAAQRVVTRTRL